MTDEERKATDDSAARVAAAKAKYDECMAVKPKAEFRSFIEWIYETYVPEERRKAGPEDKIVANDLKLARWIVANITKHLHPDQFVAKPRAK